MLFWKHTYVQYWEKTMYVAKGSTKYDYIMPHVELLLIILDLKQWQIMVKLLEQ